MPAVAFSVVKTVIAPRVFAPAACPSADGTLRAAGSRPGEAVAIGTFA